MSRLNDNAEILHIILEYLKENKDIRFFQALYNLGIMSYTNEDKFYEEPYVTLERMNKNDIVQKIKETLI